MDVSWDKKMEDYVADQLQFGDFTTATDVVKSALRMQQEYLNRRELLRREVLQGIDDIEAGRIVDPPPTVDELIASARLRMQRRT